MAGTIAGVCRGPLQKGCMGASVYPIAVTTGSSRWFVLSLALAAFVNMTGSLALGPFLAPVAGELGTSVALLGQIPSLTMLLAAGLGLIVGPLADHYGYRRTLILSLLAVAT